MAVDADMKVVAVIKTMKARFMNTSPDEASIAARSDAAIQVRVPIEMARPQARPARCVTGPG
jgi:hypothetical protein